LSYLDSPWQTEPSVVKRLESYRLNSAGWLLVPGSRAHGAQLKKRRSWMIKGYCQGYVWHLSTATPDVYPPTMLRTMRAPGGGPALRTRLVALMLAVGMLFAAAPALIPVVRWALSLI
jgi:hypothetical protein